ncbi:hypothetical protein IJJ12_01620 [bacterium]|nr:hypothetical protein [bacterium]
MAIVTALNNSLSISNLTAREILDSRGYPTIECSLTLNNGIFVVTSCSTANPAKSTDFKELRDDDPNRMKGLGVSKAVELINTRLAQALTGRNPTVQEEIDEALLALDTSQTLENIGANTTMVVSQAVLKAAALSYGWPTYYYLYKRYNLTQLLSIPTCMYGMIDGGRHGTDNLDFQEFQLIPANHLSFQRSLEIAVSHFKALGDLLKEKGAIHSVGPCGGYTPNLYKNTDAFDLMSEAARNVNLVIGRDVFFGADFDADNFYNLNRYKIKDRPEPLAGKQWVDYLQDLNKLYALYSFEDPFGSGDAAGWKGFTNEFDKAARIVCDSLTRTSAKHVTTAIKEKIGNTLLVKTGQVPTITALIQAVQTARAANWQVVVAAREGETNDDLLADLSVGIGAEFVKFGPPNRGERIAKYNRLLQIYHELQQLNQG